MDTLKEILAAPIDSDGWHVMQDGRHIKISDVGILRKRIQSMDTEEELLNETKI